MNDQRPLHQSFRVQSYSGGFTNLLKKIRSGMSQTQPLAKIARTILTLGNRQPYTIATRSLTARQRALLHFMPDAVLQWTGKFSHSAPHENIWYVGFWNYGRIFLQDSLPESGDYFVFAWFIVPSEIMRMIDERTIQEQSKSARQELELEVFFDGIDDRQKRNIVECVKDGIDHMDPILIYVDDATFTNFGPFNNLSGTPDALLEKFRRIEVSHWVLSEKRFIGCFYWLRQAELRGEEFNGVQLTPATLNEHFDRCFRRYSQILPFHKARWPESIQGKAEQLACMRKEIARSHVTCRWINGLTFYKAERFFLRSSVEPSMEDLPIELRQYIENTYRLPVTSFENCNDLFRACVETAYAAAPQEGNSLMTGIEQLIERLTILATEALKSDIGMTRGIRDIARWQQNLDTEQFGNICDWPLKDYFCGVFPSKGMRKRVLDQKQLVKILTACSVRMQYNSWHYMPGHFSKELAPHHYYFPPRMADTSIWSDQHHAGHAMAAVRHSIRSPAALKYGGRLYFGVVDLRLFRSAGAHYTRKNLLEAMRYTEYLRAVYQAILDLAASGKCRIVIKAFDKPWFERYCAALFNDMPPKQALAGSAQ